MFQSTKDLQPSSVRAISDRPQNSQLADNRSSLSRWRPAFLLLIRLQSASTLTQRRLQLWKFTVFNISITTLTPFWKQVWRSITQTSSSETLKTRSLFRLQPSSKEAASI